MHSRRRVRCVRHRKNSFSESVFFCFVQSELSELRRSPFVPKVVCLVGGWLTIDLSWRISLSLFLNNVSFLHYQDHWTCDSSARERWCHTSYTFRFDSNQTEILHCGHWAVDAFQFIIIIVIGTLRDKNRFFFFLSHWKSQNRANIASSMSRNHRNNAEQWIAMKHIRTQDGTISVQSTHCCNETSNKNKRFSLLLWLV